MPADEPHFRAMLESHPSSVMLVDDAGRISWANEQTSKLLGYSVSELIGRPVVEMRVNLHGETGNVRVDPVQLEQVVLNLVVNARDAMPDGGRVGIDTGRATFDAAYASEHFRSCPASM
ncbi:MAG TPA: PAS domain-containing protein [Candidatus Limnocylindrales bacterium]